MSAISGGAISINHSITHLQSVSSNYFRCNATGIEWYDRNSVSGGAVAFYGYSTYFEKNCFESCKGNGLGSGIYTRSTDGTNIHIFNSYLRNCGGDGPLTSDGSNEITLLNNNVSYAYAITNTAVAISAPGVNNIKHNSFVKLNTSYRYVWTRFTQVYTESNFIDLEEVNSEIFSCDLSLTISKCVFISTPKVLGSKNIIIDNSKSDTQKYMNDELLPFIIISDGSLSSIQCEGENKCHQITKNCNIDTRMSIGFINIVLLCIK